MKYKIFLAAALLSIILAIPITAALTKSNNLLKIEKTNNSQLKLQIQSDQKKADDQIKAKELENQQIKQKNDDLQKQLESKRKEQQRIASLQVARPPVTVSSGVYSGNCNDYRGLVAQYNWNVNTALAVMQAESGCNPTASSPTHDHGLMQINEVHRAAVNGDISLLNDPSTNIRVAFAVYSGAGGWTPWTTYTSGKYLKYLQ